MLNKDTASKGDPSRRRCTSRNGKTAVVVDAVDFRVGTLCDISIALGNFDDDI